jgi:hypothetical protein
MKAPRRIDSYLKEQRFGYSQSYYQRLHRYLPLVECVHFGRHEPGILIHLTTGYVDQGGGPQISPLEISVLYSDGRFSGVPSSFEKEGFWNVQENDKIIDALSNSGVQQFMRISDAALMIGTFDYLMGDDAASSCLSAFPELSQPWVARGATPLRLMSKAAYLNVEGRFGEAQQVISAICEKQRSPFDEKILTDSELCRIQYQNDNEDYLSSIGAVSPNGRNKKGT